MVGWPARAQSGALVVLLLAGALSLPPAAANAPPQVVSDRPGILMPIGSTTLVGYKIIDSDGCAYSPTNQVTLDIWGSAGLGVFPFQLKFSQCDVFQYVNITANALGTLVLSVTATDNAGTYVDAASATIEAVVHVPNDPYPPILTTAPDQWVEAVGPAGARALVWASAVDPVQGSISGARCTPPGPWFPINATGPGRTYVLCSVRDASGNIDTGGFWIQVNDTTPPVLPALFDQEVIAEPDGTVRYAVPPASDLVDIEVPLDCAPPAGSRLPAGRNEILCSATDLHGNTVTGGFFVLVVYDIAPPLILANDRHAVTTNASGRTVDFDLTVFDGTDPDPSLACSPIGPGGLFPVGTTRVTCTASDASGNRASATFDVVVDLVDVLPPELTLPPDVVLDATLAEGATHSFTATAFDATAGPLPVTCSPASGSMFPVGSTSVTCSATDPSGNTAQGAFAVTVVVRPPTIAPREDARLDATSPLGATLAYALPAATDFRGTPLTVACDPAPGATFAVGDTVVTCAALDAWGQRAETTFLVTVALPSGPAIAPHPDIGSVAATPSGARVAYVSPAATDGSGKPLAVLCVPASGSTFPLGDTLVTCTATDGFGRSVSTTFTVRVTLPPPPTIAALADQTIEATGPAGAAATWTSPTATDGLGAALAVTCSPASGSTLPLGATPVQCSATDAWGRSATTSASVTVVDTTPPALSLPSTLSLLVAGPAPVTWNASALDLVSGVRDVACAPASGSTFALGTTNVTCTATDAAGNVAARTFTVTLSPASACDIDGWRPPIDTPGHTKTGINSFKLGSTVPLKIKLACEVPPVCDDEDDDRDEGARDGRDDDDCDEDEDDDGDARSPNAAPRLFYAKLGSDGSAGAEHAGVSKSNTDNLFKQAGNHWQYGWDTRGLAAGTYRLRVDVGDGLVHTKTIALR